MRRPPSVHTTQAPTHSGPGYPLYPRFFFKKPGDAASIPGRKKSGLLLYILKK
jgi:hypothetical protein